MPMHVQNARIHTRFELEQAERYCFKIVIIVFEIFSISGILGDEFIQIHAAYTLLSNDKQKYTYEDLLKEFVEHLNNKDSIMIQILDKLIKLKEDYSINIYKKLDATSALNIYYIFKKFIL